MIENLITIAETFGIPIVLCGFLLWYVQRLVNTIVTNMNNQIQEDFTRLESIIVKLISNAKASELKNEHLIGKLDALVNVFTKLTRSKK